MSTASEAAKDEAEGFLREKIGVTKTPVSLFVYNRLDTTAQVYERIAAAKPSMLLIVADGPRADRARDEQRCAAVRALVTNPSWDCEVRLNVSDTNLGLGRRFASGLAWIFGEVEEAIVLEDDCVPDPTFFPYCDELLNRFRDDEQVMMISGDNYQFGIPRGDGSYFYSHGVGTYGWATWRRAFRAYDYHMVRWPVERAKEWLGRIWPIPEIEMYWRDRFDATYRGEIDTWDYQWAFAMWVNDGMQISPDRNLITYIGCLPSAVHTKDLAAPYCSLKTLPMPTRMTHSTTRTRQLGADLYEFHRIVLNASHDEAVSKEAAGLARADSNG